MAEVSRAAKVGIMTLVLAGAAVTIYKFLSRETGTEGGYYVWAQLPDVTGVAPHSRVMISGIQVGVIDKISLDPRTGQARLDIKMNPEVKLYHDLPGRPGSGAAVGKRATSLIGENYIVLVPGTEPPSPEQQEELRLRCKHRPADCGEEGEIRNYIEEPTIQSLQGQIADILKDVKAVTESLKNTVGTDKGQEQIAKILQNLADVTEQLNQAVRENREGVKATIENINQITGNARPELQAILQNVRTVTEDVKKMTAGPEEPGAGGKPGEIKSAVERINNASAKLDSMLGHADNVAGRLDRGEGTLGRLTKDETLINEVEGVVENVGDFVGGIGRLKTIVGLRTDYNFLANTIKSYVELRLQPAEDKYYLIELVNDPRGRTSFQQIDVDTTNPNDPPHYREIRTTTESALRFSFQFAKRMGPFTGRFGIKESTGGVGLDLHLLDDRFELQQDLFGFGETLVPRWRVALAFEFIRKLWLLGGVDEILNSDRRDYFVGLQLRFTDDDLKTILPFAPKTAP